MDRDDICSIKFWSFCIYGWVWLTAGIYSMDMISWAFTWGRAIPDTGETMGSIADVALSLIEFRAKYGRETTIK